MVNKITHGGYSSAGLLSAIAVFVGLLVYATYFAFDPHSEQQTVTENVAKPGVEAGAHIITPLSSGIFNTETLSVDNLIEPERAKVKPGEAAADIAATVAPIGDQSSAKIHNDYTPPYNAKAQRARPGHPSNRNHDLLSLTHDAENQAHFAKQYYYKNLNEGRSRGEGRGYLDSRGEFNFSLKFKSRSRMDANTSTERHLLKAINANNTAYYQYGYAVYPAYHYMYLNY